MLSLIGLVNNVIIRQVNKMNAKKYNYNQKLKNLETRSIKTKTPLVERKIVTDFNLIPEGNWCLPVFIETAPEVERNKIKKWQSSKINRYFLTNIFKVITDIR